MDLNELAKKVHANAVSKGFWDKELSDSNYLMLAVCEMAESVEADRSPHVNVAMGLPQYISVYLPIFIQCGRPHTDEVMFNSWYEGNVKGGIPEELADVVIRLLDLAGARAVDVILYADCRDSFISEVEKLTFCESSYRICQILASAFMPIGDIISISISMLYGLAYGYGIDLDAQVSLKMRYNSTREKMHGKLY